MNGRGRGLWLCPHCHCWLPRVQICGRFSGNFHSLLLILTGRPGGLPTPTLTVWRRPASGTWAGCRAPGASKVWVESEHLTGWGGWGTSQHPGTVGHPPLNLKMGPDTWDMISPHTPRHTCLHVYGSTCVWSGVISSNPPFTCSSSLWVKESIIFAS